MVILTNNSPPEVVTVLDPQAVLPAILIRSAAGAGDHEDRELSRWAGPL